ncbi:hypothetical protein QAD02_007275 [Eretmocerus hayati]|uniref:Uncharacterized protein n=1 Tax=Eretmocerus hayati TaxID=131215 RepID=A0ACC2N4G5_9HYME|nr:hypothetical protein QAD02_007275 [Eretmocerus hayati]
MKYALIFNVLLTFSLQLSADPNLPRNLDDSVVLLIANFLKTTYLPSLKSGIFGILARENISAETRKDVENALRNIAESAMKWIPNLSDSLTSKNQVFRNPQIS